MHVGYSGGGGGCACPMMYVACKLPTAVAGMPGMGATAPISIHNVYLHYI